MPSEDTIALAVLVMTIVGQLVSARWIASIPHMFRRKQWVLERRIQKHKKKMETLNSVSSFAAYSKGQRELAKLEKELESVLAGYQKQPYLVAYAPHLVAVVAQCGFVLPVLKLYGAKELVMVPNFLCFGFFRLVAFGDDTMSAVGRLVELPFSAFVADDDSVAPFNVARGDEWVRSIGVIPWCLLCYIAWWHMKSTLSRS
jgi:hypothetical protein